MNISTALPSSPQGLNVVAIGDGALCVTWDAPSYDGNSPITKFTVEVKQEGGKVWKESSTVDGNTFMADLYGLKLGNYYQVRVVPENKDGACQKPIEFYESVCATQPKSKIC